MTDDKNGQAADTTDDRREERDRRRFVWLSETAMVLLSVLVFFGFLSLLIGVYFPRGTSLVADPDANALTGNSGNGDVDISVNSAASGDTRQYAVSIVDIQRRVQHRDANSLTWRTASVGDTVVQRDALQTFTRSTAVMEVADNGTLTMAENSLIVFEEQQPDPFRAEQASVLMMVEGELAGSLESEEDDQFQFGVGLPNGDLTLRPNTPGDDVQFLVTVNDDMSTTVNIHEGTARVTGRDGSYTDIESQQFLTLDPNGTMLEIDELAEAPSMTTPADGFRVTYRNSPDEIVFSWNAVAGADRYHIVIARDADFSDRVVDDDVIGTRFTHGALRAGTYHWYVRSRTGWSQSSASAAHQISVIQDRIPPELELNPPPERVVAGTWRLRGRTDADARVFVDDVAVTHDSGFIDHPLELQPGANIIVVEALDDAGNLSYAPLLVTAK